MFVWVVTKRATGVFVAVFGREDLAVSWFDKKLLVDEDAYEHYVVHPRWARI